MTTRRTVGRVLVGAALLGALLVACAPMAPAPTPTVAPTPTAVAKAPPATPTAAPTVTPTKGPPEKVKLSYPSAGLSHVLYFLARDMGYYQQEGLEVEFLVIAAAPSVKALIGGSHEFEASLGSAKEAIIQGAPLKLVFVGRSTPFHIHSKPEITSIEGLKGKTIGLNSMGSIIHLIGKLVLRKHGLDPDKDVSWTALGPGAAPMAALRAGSIDATALSDTYGIQLEEWGFRRLAAMRDYHNGPSGGMAVREAYLKEKPQTVKKMVRTQLKALAAFMAQTPQARAVVEGYLTKEGGMSPDLARKLYDRELASFTEGGQMEEASLKQDIDILAQQMEVKEDIPASKLYDFSVVKAAYEELKKEGWKP